MSFGPLEPSNWKEQTEEARTGLDPMDNVTRLENPHRR